MALDAAQERVAIGSVAADVRLFAVCAPPATHPATASRDGATVLHQPGQMACAPQGDEAGAAAVRHDVLQPVGCLQRNTSQRVCHLEFSENDAFLMACSAGMLMSST
jgi:hypothetical protein